MPSVSTSQQAFMGAELARKRAGKPTRTHMTEEQLKHFASTKRKGLPRHSHAAAKKLVAYQTSRARSASAASRSASAARSGHTPKSGGKR